MAYIVWDAPVYTNNINTLKPAMAELDSKLTTIGLIDYLSTNANNLTNFADISTVPAYGVIKLTELNYKLPTGTGKTIFENVPGTDYKKIINESYDSTEVYIKIVFYANNLYGASVSHNNANTSGYIGYSTMTYISGTPEFNDYHLIDNTIQGSNSPGGAQGYAQGTKKCIICLTGNVFSLFWLDRYYYMNDSNSNVYAAGASLQPTLFFSIYREKNKISVNTRKAPNNGAMYTSNDQGNTYGYHSASFFLLGLYEYEITNKMPTGFIYKNPIEYMRKVPENAPKSLGENAQIYPTYMNLYDDMTINPALCRIYVDSPYKPDYNALISKYDVITYHKGQKVKLQYYNLSLLFHKLKSNKGFTSINGVANTECSYLLLLEDYPVTSEEI